MSYLANNTNFYCLLIILLALYASNEAQLVPKFDSPNENVTVIFGNTAILPCFISDIGDHKVAWIKVGTTDVMYIGDYKITNDERIKIQHSYFSDWSLLIQQVNDEDSGEYICQVNTEPQMIKKIALKVLLPPKIVEEKSLMNPNSIIEGQKLKLHCEADGSPKPQVTWYFRHYSETNVNQTHVSIAQRKFRNNSVIHSGETLIINNITRDYSGIFECIASNLVPPAASRKIRVSVEFEPEVYIEKRIIETVPGLNVHIECEIKANPLLSYYWFKDGRVIENSPPLHMFKLMHEHNRFLNSKYQIHNFKSHSNEFKTISTLIIRNVSKHDFGTYECHGINKFKKSKATSDLREIIVPNTHVTMQNSINDGFESYNDQSLTATWKSNRKKTRKQNNTQFEIVQDMRENLSNINYLNSGSNLSKCFSNIVITLVILLYI